MYALWCLLLNQNNGNHTMSERVSHRFMVMYDRVCHISCNWSRLQPRLKIPSHQSIM